MGGPLRGSIDLDPEAANAIRESRGLTVEAVANRLEKDPKMVRRWFKGKTGVTLANAYALAGLLGCTIKQLMGAESHPAVKKQAEIRFVGIVIKLDADRSEWSDERLAATSESIKQYFLSNGFQMEEGDMDHESTEFGSVFLTYRMREDLARELVRASKANELTGIGIVDAEIKEEPQRDDLDGDDLEAGPDELATRKPGPWRQRVIAVAATVMIAILGWGWFSSYQREKNLEATNARLLDELREKEDDNARLLDKLREKEDEVQRLQANHVKELERLLRELATTEKSLVSAHKAIRDIVKNTTKRLRGVLEAMKERKDAKVDIKKMIERMLNELQQEGRRFPEKPE
jgi:transcriptional regulator with XRE-family HTH domain